MFNTIVAVFFALPVCRCTTKVHLIQCVLVCFMFNIDNKFFIFFGDKNYKVHNYYLSSLFLNEYRCSMASVSTQQKKTTVLLHPSVCHRCSKPLQEGAIPTHHNQSARQETIKYLASCFTFCSKTFNGPCPQTRGVQGRLWP